jgi:predicted secreted protein
MKTAAWLLVVSCWFADTLCAAEKPIAVSVGQEFKLALESNPSTGNQWLLAKPLDEHLLKLLGTEYRRGRSGTPGAPGNEILSFRALSDGKAEIRLKYGRLWERDSGAARKTNFVVVISRSAVR